MLNVFLTEDGIFHQAVLSLNKLILVRLVVEKLALDSDPASEWEWMVWQTAGRWDVGSHPVGGREMSLATAKRQALDAGLSMLTDLTRDRPPVLPALLSMRLPEHWRADIGIEQH